MTDRPRRPAIAFGAADCDGSGEHPWGVRWFLMCKGWWRPPRHLRRFQPVSVPRRWPGTPPSRPRRRRVSLPVEGQGSESTVAQGSAPGVPRAQRSGQQGLWPGNPQGCNAAPRQEPMPHGRHRRPPHASTPDQPPASADCSRRTRPPRPPLQPHALGRQRQLWQCAGRGQRNSDARDGWHGERRAPSPCRDG